MTYHLGHYIYMEATSAVEGRTAILEIPISNNGVEHCLMFSYHMYGASMGSLAVYSKFGSQSATEMWQESGSPEYCYTIVEYY